MERKKYTKLIEYLKKRKCTQLKLAKAIGLHNISLHNKLNGKTSFTASDISKIRDYFDMTPDEVVELFFKQ